MLGVAGFTGLAAAGGLVRPGIVWATAGPARVKSMVD
jgi:alpha-L-fucosidase